jgi:hypothetical protein
VLTSFFLGRFALAFDHYKLILKFFDLIRKA